MEETVVGQVAVVTGGSSGIGFELARELLARGFDVLIVAEDDGVRRAARELGPRANALQVDLASYRGVERLYAHMKGMGRPIDVVAINAGVGTGGAFAGDTKLEDELNIINLNVMSTVHLAKRVVPDMVARCRGRILLTSSLAANFPGPFFAVYAASKAFIQSFAEGLRNELEGTGVTVTAMMPGATDTEFFERANMLETKVGQGQKDDPALVAQQGVDALLEGKDSIVCGALRNKMQAIAARVLPDATKAAMQRKQTEPHRPH
ncbi:MAG: SDR family NAD(P)-dependent oxidoreductase [Myxococcota bacterium]